ncbi:MAG TPA: DUF885 family protein, partial [Steroidobacter sp.]|nr:DUF885 family protein [Steroidobacter sp.]
MHRLVLLFFWLVALSANAADADWIAESNRHATILLETTSRYRPEFATLRGVESYDDDVLDLQPRFAERQEADLDTAVKKLEASRAETTDPRVRQDLDILIDAARSRRTSSEINRTHLLPFFDLPQAVFSGFKNLIDERIPKERQKAALIRLKRYVGAERGYEPITKLAQARYEEAARNPALLGPWIVEAQQYLANQRRYMDGIEDLLKKSGLTGWQKDMRTLRRHIDDYGAWVRSTVLPRARKSHQLPPEVYADNLRQFGVKMDPREVIDRATANYIQTRAEMKSLSRALAAQRGWQSADHRDVLRRLKQERIADDKLLAFYQERLARVEDIVRRERIVTLPTRKAVIRLATEAESAVAPGPHVDPPRFVGNTGEPVQFVLTTGNPNATPGAQMDEFNNDAISWALTAHEARPGHELQFASMLEHGVSIARAVFAFNSANIEGWAQYAEAQIKEY